MLGDIRCRYTGETVLAFGAHPDDVELGMGGTAAKLARAGARVIVVVASVPNDYDRRLAEAKRAARILGADFRILFGQRCSRIEDFKNYELVERVDSLVHEFKPAAVFSHGPGDFHRDHKLMFEACLAAQRLAFMDFYSYYPTSTRPVQVNFNPQVFVDVSDTIELKLEAVSAHPSQFSQRGLRVDFLKDIARAYGKLAGVDYAEGLELVRLQMKFTPVPRAAAPRDAASSAPARSAATTGPRSRP